MCLILPFLLQRGLATDDGMAFWLVAGLLLLILLMSYYTRYVFRQIQSTPTDWRLLYTGPPIGAARLAEMLTDEELPVIVRNERAETLNAGWVSSGATLNLANVFVQLASWECAQEVLALYQTSLVD